MTLSTKMEVQLLEWPQRFGPNQASIDALKSLSQHGRK